MLVGNVVTYGHHAKTISPNFSLEKKIKRAIRLRIKGIKWEGNKGIHDNVQLTLYIGTHKQDLHFPVIIAPSAETSPLCHFTHTYNYLDWFTPGKHPKLKES
jgi:hypothetical protein